MTYYRTKTECQEKKKEHYNSNKRYRNFTQTEYTAGDTEQFAFIYSLSKGKKKNIDLQKNIFHTENYNHGFFSKYNTLNSDCVKKTFEYIFFKFKKGIYIKIKNNKLEVFLPFSNANYCNEWSSNINFNYDIFRKSCKIENYKFVSKKVNKFVKNWFANNHLVRYEYPINERDTNIDIIKDMFEELCRNRILPDMEFFINKRDHPILTKDGTEPYKNIWNNDKLPLVSHNENKYLPILSMCISDKFADVVIPTYEDWSRIARKENKYFISTYTRHYDDNFYKNWKNKKSVAVFRGSNTGDGVTVETNLRLKLANISYKLEQESNSTPILDAGITKWNSRPRKEYGNCNLTVIDDKSFDFGLKEKLTPREQSNYKYIINVDGHVSAYRLSLELAMYSVILKVDSEWKIWFSHLLKPYKHYVPVKSDLSDLVEQIKWCKKNDKICEQIAINARFFYEKYLSKSSTLDYLQHTLCELKTYNGYYKNCNFEYLKLKSQIKLLRKSYTFPSFECKETLPLKEIKDYDGTYGYLKVMEYLVNFMIIKNKTPFLNGDVIFENKNTKILKCKLAGVEISVKISNKHEYKKIVNSVFMGKFIVNELVRNGICNFSYTFNSFVLKDKICVVYEYIDGVNLLDYINSKNFTYKDFIKITLQICLCLQTSQQMCEYVHNDLTPWNIIIKKLKSKKIVKYNINGQIYSLETDIIPVIIDYENSQGVFNNVKYGSETLETNLEQDLFVYLITTLNVIVKNNLISFKNIKKTAGYLTFLGLQENIENIKNINFFLYYSRKYDYLTRLPKTIKQKKSPIELFNYITCNNKNILPFTVNNNYLNQRITYEPVKIFLSIFNKKWNYNVERINTDVTKSMDLIVKYYYIYLLENYTNTSKEILKSLYTVKGVEKHYTPKTISLEAKRLINKWCEENELDKLDCKSTVIYDSFKLRNILNIILNYNYKIDIPNNEREYLKNIKNEIVDSVKTNTIYKYF